MQDLLAKSGSSKIVSLNKTAFLGEARKVFPIYVPSKSPCQQFKVGNDIFESSKQRKKHTQLLQIEIDACS